MEAHFCHREYFFKKGTVILNLFLTIASLNLATVSLFLAIVPLHASRLNFSQLQVFFACQPQTCPPLATGLV